MVFGAPGDPLRHALLIRQRHRRLPFGQDTVLERLSLVQ